VPATADLAPAPAPDVRPPEPAASAVEIADAGAPQASEPAADDPSPQDKEVDKKDARALYQEGTALFVRGKLGAAKRAFKATLRANPQHAGAHRGLGLIYQAAGKKRAAIRHFKRYLRLRANAADAGKIRKRLATLEK
jgi:tetratricopeptide (TPR) repeat protein